MAMARLVEMQCQHQLPVMQLDMPHPTCWNVTLNIVQRLQKQPQVIIQYLCEYGTRTGSGEFVDFSPQQLLFIKTPAMFWPPLGVMVSSNQLLISDSITLVFLLKHMLCLMTSWGHQ